MAGSTTAKAKRSLQEDTRELRLWTQPGDGKTYTRMTGFTSMSESKNSTEYSRQYVDEASERSDVVGYSPSNDYDLTDTLMILYSRRLQRLQMMNFLDQMPR